MHALVACFLHLVQFLAAQQCPYEALDSSGVPTRDAKRRGAGWLPGLADIGWSNRLGWYEGFHLLLAVNPGGGDHRLRLWGCEHAKINPWRRRSLPSAAAPHPGLPSVGAPACGPYVVDKGFEGQANQATWWQGLWRPGHLPAQAQ